MIEAHHAETVERHVLDELAEGCAHGVEIAVVVEMLGVDIGNDGDFRWQLQEGAVRSCRPPPPSTRPRPCGRWCRKH